MNNILTLTSEKDLDKALSNDVLLIFKHSPRCPISFNAYAEVSDFISRYETPVFMIDVVGNHGLSQQFAARFGI